MSFYACKQLVCHMLSKILNSYYIKTDVYQGLSQNLLNKDKLTSWISAFLQKCKATLSSHLVVKQESVSSDTPQSRTNFFDLQLLLLQSQQGTKQLVSSFPLGSPAWGPFQRALSPLRAKEWWHFPLQACSTAPPIPPSGQTHCCTDQLHGLRQTHPLSPAPSVLPSLTTSSKARAMEKYPTWERKIPFNIQDNGEDFPQGTSEEEGCVLAFQAQSKTRSHSGNSNHRHKLN